MTFAWTLNSEFRIFADLRLFFENNLIFLQKMEKYPVYDKASEHYHKKLNDVQTDIIRGKYTFCTCFALGVIELHLLRIKVG